MFFKCVTYNVFFTPTGPIRKRHTILLVSDWWGNIDIMSGEIRVFHIRRGC